MAAVAGSETAVETVNITINDIDIAVPKGELIVESVKRLGLEIPIFCYHSRMKPVGMCRMCLVEVGMKQPDGSVRKMPKPQAGCTLPASEGLVIYTDTEMVHNDRRGVLEFLLINHPLDCPICDRGGECPLQNNTLFYGPSTSRFVELKRHLPKAFPLSKYVTLDLERCIQCGRCVRFTEEISGDAQLAFRFRGASMQPSTFELTDFDSKFSGNVIEICPVGALTSARYRFRARPWDLETRPAICTICSNGCNIWFDYRVGKLVRVNGRTNEAVNEEWTCDRGKFGHGFYNSEQRLTTPLVRQGDALIEADWPSAYNEILRVFTKLGGEAVAALGGQSNSNEDLFMLRRLFTQSFGSQNIDYRWNLVAPREEPKYDQLPIAEYENQVAVLLFGTSLADEEPILFLRIRKAWFKNGCRVVVAHHAPTDADSFAHLVLRYKPGTAATLAAGFAGTQPLEAVASATGVSLELLREAVETVRGAPVVATRTLYDLQDGEEIVKTLSGLPGPFSLYGLNSNDQGAAEMGFALGPNTTEILTAAANGAIKALWIIGADPFALYPDRELVTRALENVDFLVVQDHTETEATHYASVVLPMTAPAEAEGTFTNLERRVQSMRQILKPLGSAKPAWRVCEELSVRMQPRTPLFNPGEIMDKMASELRDFRGVSYDLLGGEGFLLGVGADRNREDLPAPQTNG